MNCSLDIKSFIEEPWGWDRSMISLADPSLLGAEPMGEQCVRGKGGLGKGPAVCPRAISLFMASRMGWGLSVADLWFLGRVSEDSPVKPMSKPWRKPLIIYNTSCLSG